MTTDRARAGNEHIADVLIDLPTQAVTGDVSMPVGLVARKDRRMTQTVTITVSRSTLDIAIGSMEARYERLADTGRTDESSAAMSMLGAAMDELRAVLDG